MSFAVDLVEGAVFLADEDDVFDGAGADAGAGGEGIFPIIDDFAFDVGIGDDLGSHLVEGLLIRERDDLEGSLHDVAGVGSAFWGDEIFSAVGSGTDSLGTGDEEEFAILGAADEGGEPTCGDEALDAVCCEVDDGDGVEAGASDVEGEFVGGEGGAEGDDSAEGFELGDEQLDLAGVFAGVGIDDGDGVVGGVGDVNEARADGDGAGAGTADGFEIVAA